MSEAITHSVTPEFVARIEKLEGIFMPYSRSEREKKMRRDNPEATALCDMKMRFAHYTSAEAGLRIIETKQLWMRNAKAMADFEEVDLGYNALLDYFRIPANKTKFLDAANACVTGSGESILGIFDKWWDHIRFNTYVLSVSDHQQREDNFGRLSMWRAFGSGKPRIALIFDVPLISDAAQVLGLNFSPVSYPSKENACAQIDLAVANTQNECAYLQSALTNEEFIRWWFATLIHAVTCTKHEGFYEEREWRGVYTTELFPVSPLKYSIETLLGAPQKVFKIPLDAVICPEAADLDMSKVLSRVIIGPTTNSWVIYEAFVDVLTKAGVPDAGQKVWASNIPLRD